MTLSTDIIEAVLQSQNKALASIGKGGINVVPVSTIRVVDNTIWLMNYFLRKTLDNIIENPNIALSCWTGLKGYQIKGTVEYVAEGAVYENARQWVTDNVPNRTLKGLLIITPSEIYDISPQE